MVSMAKPTSDRKGPFQGCFKVGRPSLPALSCKSYESPQLGVTNGHHKQTQSAKERSEPVSEVSVTTAQPMVEFFPQLRC